MRSLILCNFLLHIHSGKKTMVFITNFKGKGNDPLFLSVVKKVETYGLNHNLLLLQFDIKNTFC